MYLLNQYKLNPLILIDGMLKKQRDTIQLDLDKISIYNADDFIWEIVSFYTVGRIYTARIPDEVRDYYVYTIQCIDNALNWMTGAESEMALMQVRLEVAEKVGA